MPPPQPQPAHRPPTTNTTQTTINTTTNANSGDVAITVNPATFVATVEIRRPPHNYFDTALIRQLADIWEQLDPDPDCRAIVLCSQGRNFCAGRDFSRTRDVGDSPEALYGQAVRLLAGRTPWVAAVHGGAIGGGLGLALAADFRVAGPRAWFRANFAKLGFHHGFGLGVTLPRVLGAQRAAELLYTGDRIDAARAAEIGLVDHLADADDDLRDEAAAFAARIAASAPLAVSAIRETLRDGLVEAFRRATAAEADAQRPLRETTDFAEGIAAARERRPPQFTGR